MGVIFSPGVQASGEKMIFVPQGFYVPLFRQSDADKKGTGKEDRIPVAPFYLDSTPVTNGDFLSFVREHPRWRKSRAKPLFVDTSYLQHWKSDVELGAEAGKDLPVVNVSWFAARAYCRAQGKRLPTTAEWERAAAPPKKDPALERKILDWYARNNTEKLSAVGRGKPNALGIHDLHGLVWEWVRDYNTALVTGESRGDSSLERTLFCGSGSVGSADPGDYAAFMRYAFRSSLKAVYTVPNLGFRCAKPAPSAGPSAPAVRKEKKK